MKHAGDAALDSIDPLLIERRRQNGLVERKRGVFYRKSAAFVHFHEDPAGFFADVRAGGSWHRLPVNTPSERSEFIRRVRAAVA